MDYYTRKMNAIKIIEHLLKDNGLTGEDIAYAVQKETGMGYTFTYGIIKQARRLTNENKVTKNSETVEQKQIMEDEDATSRQEVG